MTINFDMDGTINRFYDVPNWLPMLEAEEVTPYLVAKPKYPMTILAKYLNALQAKGHRLAIISWTSKGGTPRYNAQVEKAKILWLMKHLPSVQWDEIHIVPYGTPKTLYCQNADDILFDDEARNLENWGGRAYSVEDMGHILRMLIRDF